MLLAALSRSSVRMLASPEDAKDEFYGQLDRVLSSVPYHHKLILMGDFKARVGRDSEAWEKILGKHGLGNENSNGTRLLSLCPVHQLSITNTLFQQKNRRKTSCRHPRSGHWHLIDYIIVRQRDVSDVCLTRSFRGPTCWSDHCLIRSKLSIYTPVKHRHTRKSLKRLNTKALSGTDTQAMLQVEFSEALCTATHPVADNVDDEWTFIRDSTYRAAANTLGFKRHVHRDWFDENNLAATQLLDELHHKHMAWINDRNSANKEASYKQARQMPQRELPLMKNSWWAGVASELEAAATQAWYEVVLS